MLRNREFIIFAVIVSAVTAVASTACFAVNEMAGFICLAGCLSVSVAGVFFTIYRYRKIAELSAYLRRLTDGKPVLDIRDNTEGELSILKNEIYKATIALMEQKDMLLRDKKELATALSDISHQLKTPLTSLGIMADLLEDDELPPDKRYEFITNIRDCLSKMEWLVLSLLKLARLDADAVKLKAVSTSLPELVGKAVSPMLIPTLCLYNR